MVLPSLEDVVTKWKERAAVATTDYVKGIKRTTDWQEKTKKASGTWKTAVTDPKAQNRFESGVGRVDNSKWQAKAEAKSDRFGSGVAAADAEYRDGMGQVMTHIAAGLPKLSPRGPRGSPANLARVTAWFNHMKEFARK